MKLKNKILPIISAVGIAGVVTPLVTLTSCKKDNVELQKYDFSAEMYESTIDQYESSNPVSTAAATKLYRDSLNASDIFKDDLLQYWYWSNYIPQWLSYGSELKTYNVYISQPVIGTTKVVYPGTPGEGYTYPTATFELVVEIVTEVTNESFTTEVKTVTKYSYKNVPFILSTTGGSGGAITAVPKTLVPKTGVPVATLNATSPGFYGDFGIDFLDTTLLAAGTFTYMSDAFSISGSREVTTTVYDVTKPEIKFTQTYTRNCEAHSTDGIRSIINNDSWVDVCFTSYHLNNIECDDEINDTGFWGEAHSPWKGTTTDLATVKLQGFRFANYGNDDFPFTGWKLTNPDSIILPLDTDSVSKEKYVKGNYCLVIPANATVTVDELGYGSIDATISNYDSEMQPLANSFTTDDIGDILKFDFPAKSYELPHFTAKNTNGDEIPVYLNDDYVEVYLYGTMKLTEYKVVNPVEEDGHWDGLLQLSFNCDVTTTLEQIVIFDENDYGHDNNFFGYATSTDSEFEGDDGIITDIVAKPWDSDLVERTHTSSGVTLVISLFGEDGYDFKQLDHNYTVSLDFKGTSDDSLFFKNYFQVVDTTRSFKDSNGIAYNIELPETSLTLTVPAQE